MKAISLVATLVLQAATARSDSPLPPHVAQQIQDEAAHAAPGLIEIRRQIHRFPELSGQEKKTAALVGSAVPIHASIPFFGEDFAYFQERVPGAMFFLGVGNAEKGITAYNHMPDYDLDEAAIETGTAAMSGVLLSYLEGH